ncbi:DUF6361 family protein [Homoserinimonas sp. OAct 916]|uniref:DUF6361 family protein n=1 Tax=Homoserinimonas sp. OAct 916 TaxID=2211450 RepID=UPI000DBE1D31|nr:DUF6361 family protein [Homoserinimonas sp. OAct 916]
MAALVAWLDASSEQQRRMREIVNLFSDRDSRDELGIGQIRDALSDTLFPGTSTLFTRARYMLFVPWVFVTAHRPGQETNKIAARVDKSERTLISTLLQQSDGVGLIGKEAGAALKTLPSNFYWVALRQYGILRVPSMTRSDVIATGIGTPATEEDQPYVPGAWSPTLPPAPKDFPENTDTGFDLSRPEAEWLRDRILEGAEGSLLAHLLGHRPQPTSDHPWSDPATLSAPTAVREQLRHARLFSFTVNGASLLYNLLLAEAYDASDFDRVDGRVDDYRLRLSEWERERENLAGDLHSWDRDDFWELVQKKNSRMAGSMRFMNEWLDRVLTDGPLDLADDTDLRSLIANRERRKGAQARLRNARLLQSWSGAAGTGRLTYRWGQVRGILTDLHDGLERDDA